MGGEAGMMPPGEPALMDAAVTGRSSHLSKASKLGRIAKDLRGHGCLQVHRRRTTSAARLAAACQPSLMTTDL
jgi:hypothetical protein